MTVFVDHVFTAKPKGKAASRHGCSWCHMISTSQEELHAMAELIGLKRSYYQPHIFYPHYDLTPSKRMNALKLGAVEIKSIVRYEMRKTDPEIFLRP